MISEFLKQKTTTEHQELERVIIPSLKSINSKEDYARVLHVFYGFFKPVEALIAPKLSEALLPDMHQRRKSSAIQQDIHHITGDAENLAVTTELPGITNEKQAMGAMYVLEGSTLGGAIISKMIVKNIGSDAEGALHFFNSYGEDTMEMWGKFKAQIDKLPEESKEEIAAAAADTFRKFKLWATKALHNG